MQGIFQGAGRGHQTDESGRQRRGPRTRRGGKQWQCPSPVRVSSRSRQLGRQLRPARSNGRGCNQTCTAPADAKCEPDTAADGSEQNLRVAAIAGGAVLLLGCLIALIVWGLSGNPDEENAPGKEKNVVKGKNNAGDDIIQPGPGGKGRDDNPPPPVVRTFNRLSDEEEKEIVVMKRKALAWFMKAQLPSGNWIGENDDFSGLGGLALLEAGIKKTDPHVKKAATHVRSKIRGFKDAYGICFGLLFLAKLEEAEDKDLIKHMTMRLVIGQQPHGAWGYSVGEPSIPAAQLAETFAFLKDLGKDSWEDYQRDNPEKVLKMSPTLKNLGFLKTANLTSHGYFENLDYDNSHTHVALLAMWAVRRKPYEMPVDHPLRLIVRRFRESQSVDSDGRGYWRYTARFDGESGGAMTCAGLFALAVGYVMDSEELERKGKQQSMSLLKDPQVKKAMRFIGDIVRTSAKTPLPGGAKKPPQTEQVDGPPHMFGLWSIERVGVLYQIEKIDDDVEWFRHGFQILKKRQKEDGSWKFEFSGAITTAFALLFLERANLAQDLTDEIKRLEDLIAPAPAAIRKE